jgi:hypothetical protein
MTPPVVKWSGDGDHYCRTCKVSFRTVEAKLAHMNQQRRAGKLGHITCQICAEGFYSEEAMFGHLREVRTLPAFCVTLSLCLCSALSCSLPITDRLTPATRPTPNLRTFIALPATAARLRSCSSS